MSSLATAPPSAVPARTAVNERIRLFAGADSVLGALLGGGVTLVALIAGGGVDLAPNTWVQIVLTLCAAAVAIALVVTRPRRIQGGASLALFAGLAALTALSITWSVQPQSSWLEANRTLSYLAVFAVGVGLASLAGERWAALLGAVLCACAAISAYALLAKVFPASLDPGETFGRLRAPFDYWNATGLIGALGLAPALWAGARRDRARALRALSVPAVAVLLSVVVLAYSRGALLVSVIGLAIWFLAVPLRLRGALILVLGAAGAAVISAYALATGPLTRNLVPLAQRTSAGHAFGVLLVLVLIALAAAGLLAAFAIDRAALPAERRRRIGVGLLCATAMLPVGGVAALALSSRGLTGEVSHVWSSLTSSSGGVGNSPSRLVELGNSRGRYWNEGLKVGEHALLAGTGALGYATAVTRYTDDSRVVSHAHSYVVETFADLGLIGLTVSLALLIAWALAARRTLTGARIRERAARRTPAPAREPTEQAALLTLLVVVVTFGVHSAIDWTWFIPGTAIPALLCAGWLAGRGPAPARRRPRPRLAPGPLGAVLAILTASLLACWAIWQPLRAADADAAALTAISDGNARAAIADANRAAAEDPVSIEPVLELAAIDDAAGHEPAARAQLLRAIERQPRNPLSWLSLGQFELRHHHPRLALAPLQRAHQLDLRAGGAAAMALAAATAQLHASRQ